MHRLDVMLEQICVVVVGFEAAIELLQDACEAIWKALRRTQNAIVLQVHGEVLLYQHLLFLLLAHVECCVIAVYGLEGLLDKLLVADSLCRARRARWGLNC